MEIVIADDPRHPNLYAELWVKGQPWAEVIYDAQKERYLLIVYLGEQDDWLTLDLAEVRKALADAKEALVAKGYPDIRI